MIFELISIFDQVNHVAVAHRERFLIQAEQWFLFFRNLFQADWQEFSELLLEIIRDVALIELGEVNFDAEFSAVSLSHFNIFILWMLTERVFVDHYFVKLVRSERSLFNRVNPLKICHIVIIDANSVPLITGRLISQKMHFNQVGLLLDLNGNWGHFTLHLEDSLDIFVPQGQIVPKQCNVTKVVRLVPHAQKPVIVEWAGQEDLSGHIYEVVLHVELEVDFFVKAWSLFARLAEHQNLNCVHTWLQVNPDYFRWLVLIESEDSFVVEILIVIFILVVRLNLVPGRQELVPLANVQLHDLVVVRTVEYLQEETHLERDFKVVAVEHFKLPIRTRSHHKGTFVVRVVNHNLIVTVHPVKNFFQVAPRLFVCEAKHLFISVLVYHFSLADWNHTDFNWNVRAYIKLVERQDRVRIVDHNSVVLVLLYLLSIQYLRRANLRARYEAILAAIFVRPTQWYHRIDAEGLPDHNLEVGVELGLDHDLLFQIVQIHDDFVVEVEFLAGCTIDEFSLDEVIQQENKWTVIPAQQNIQLRWLARWNKIEASASYLTSL